MSRMKLKDIAVEKNERVDNPSQSPYSIFVGLEHYDSGEATIRRYGSTEMLESTMKVFHTGDILVARRNVYLRRAATVDFDGLTSGDSIVLHIENEAYRRIIPFVLNTDDFWNYANQHADGSMSKRLSPKLLMEYEFSVPEENLEQISEILWAMERTKNAYRELIAKTDDLLKAEFVEMFGDPASNPKGWIKCKVQDVMVGKVSNGFFAKPTDYSPDGNAGIICVGDVVNRKYSNIEGLRRANASDSDYAKYAVHYGDALFCRSSLVKEGIGKASIVPQNAPKDVLFECHVIRVPLNTTMVLPEFFQALTTTLFFRQQMMDKSKTATMTTIGQKDIVSTDIYVPEMSLQEQFVELSKQSDKSILAAQQTLIELTYAQKALMKKVF